MFKNLDILIDAEPKTVSGGEPVHARVPIHAHPQISPKQSQLPNKLPVYIMHLIIIYVVVNIFSMKNYRYILYLKITAHPVQEE